MSAEAHCKACGKPMTEGRAYELGSHRWHVGCFRCSTCNDQLTAHTNMLVLGDGTLVCANCSYECAVCSKKIKDMAVLTNDQAFCASCFVCRNCKKRIDDLQYARTSQGIFCMVCHTALLARKRQLQQLKKQQQLQSQTQPAQKTPLRGQSPATAAVQTPVNQDSPRVADPGARLSKSSMLSVNSLKRDKDLPDLPDLSATDTLVSQVTPQSVSSEDFSTSRAKLVKEGLDTSSSNGSNTSNVSGNTSGNVSGSTSGNTSGNISGNINGNISGNSSGNISGSSSGSGTSANGSANGTNSTNANGTNANGRHLRVPRKQLAPSAFNAGLSNSRSDLSPVLSTSSENSNSRSTSSTTDPDSKPDVELLDPLPIGHMPHSSSQVSIDRSRHISATAVQPEPQQQSRSSDGLSTPPRTRSRSRTATSEASGTPRMLLSGTVTPILGSPATSLASSATSASIAASLNGNALDAQTASTLTPEGVNVPRRSQLRPVSPARSWVDRSPQHPGSQSAAVPNSKHLHHHQQQQQQQQQHPPPVPIDRHPASVTASPTQAAAPQGTPKSPFNRWWHKQSDSISSTKSSGSTYIPITLSHKRSNSENTIGSPPSAALAAATRMAPPLSSNPATLTEALAALRLEQERSKLAEQKIRDLEHRDKTRDSPQDHDSLRSERSQLERQIERLCEEQKILTSRNKQLKEMNAELERQTLEKFGPNSLWGSQNPPLDSSHTSPASSSKDIGGPSLTQSSVGGPMQLGGSADSPMVTRLDDPQIESTTSQAQFLPLKSAKQWFFRRPNKLSSTNNSGAGTSAALTATGPYNGKYDNGPSAGPAYNGSGFPGGNAGQRNFMQGFKSYNQPNGNSSNPVLINGNYAGQMPPANGLGGAGSSILGDNLIQRTEIDKVPVPYFVTRCFSEIESRGLDTEGIYRKPGSKSQIDAILAQFGPTGDPKVGEELLGGEIQAVSSAVKQYLRGLSEPVICYDAYEAFVAAGNSGNPEVLRQAVHSLPPAHLETLKAIVSHLTLVASHEANNLMNVRNLAMVFAPTIAREESGDREIPDMQARNDATQMLILHPDVVLGPTDELL